MLHLRDLYTHAKQSPGEVEISTQPSDPDREFVNSRLDREQCLHDGAGAVSVIERLERLLAVMAGTLVLLDPRFGVVCALKGHVGFLSVVRGGEIRGLAAPVSFAIHDQIGQRLRL